MVINYLTRKDEAERTMSAIQSEGGTALLFQADITKASEVKALIAATVDHCELLLKDQNAFRVTGQGHDYRERDSS